MAKVAKADVCRLPRGTEQRETEKHNNPKGQGQVDATVPKTRAEGGSGRGGNANGKCHRLKARFKWSQ